MGGLHNYYLSENVRKQVADCFETHINNVQENGECCRSVWFPGHQFNGLLYRENENIIFITSQGEIVAKILNIFTVRISEQSRAYLTLKRFHWAGDATNSDHKTVEESNHVSVGELRNISRKVMLQRIQDSENKFILIDFMRRIFPIVSGSVVVSYYPVMNDMVLVQGEASDEEWKARVTAFNMQRKSLQCRFFVKENGFWIPERNSQNQSISFHSVLGIANGVWLTEYTKWLES